MSNIQISRLLSLETALQNMASEMQLMREVSRRQNLYIRELYDLKTTAATKAELHAAVVSAKTGYRLSGMQAYQKYDDIDLPVDSEIGYERFTDPELRELLILPHCVDVVKCLPI